VFTVFELWAGAQLQNIVVIQSSLQLPSPGVTRRVLCTRQKL
jgi:hypothetical protein